MHVGQTLFPRHLGRLYSGSTQASGPAQAPFPPLQRESIPWERKNKYVPWRCAAAYWLTKLGNRDMFRLICRLSSQVTVDISKFPLPEVLQLRTE